MSGIGTVVIKDKEWSVNVATTPSELLQGLSGVVSIPANTGMLFDLGAEGDVVKKRKDIMNSLE